MGNLEVGGSDHEAVGVVGLDGDAARVSELDQLLHGCRVDALDGHLTLPRLQHVAREHGLSLRGV